MSANKTRIAIVGAGHVAQVAHIPAYKANPEVELVAIVDYDAVKAKRIVRTRDGHSRIDQMGAMALVQGVRAGYGTKTPKDQQLADVTVLDVFGNVASVKCVMSGWVDYMHIGKVDGRWVIINVLWEMKPEKGQ